MKVLTFIIAILFSNAVIAKQQYYKWTDENGNTHYTSEKPENKKTEEVTVNTNQPKVSQNIEIADETEIVESTEKSYLERHKEKKLKAKITAKKNKNLCQQSRQIVMKYQQRVRITSTDKETGETIYFDDSKRVEIVNEAKKSVKKYCR